MYDKELGTLLIGTWINTMLYVWELTQIHRYVSKYPSDRLLIKITVASAFLFDSAASVGGYAWVYLDTVVHWGDKEYLTKQPWPQSLCVAATGASAAVTQTFLVYRYWRLTNHIALSVVILLLMGTSTAGSFACAIILVISPNYSDRNRVKWSAILWFLSSVATDIITAAVLLIEFIRTDATFKSTKRLLHKLVSLTVKTGTFTAVWAMGILGVFLVCPSQDNIAAGMNFCMGRVYTLTLLFNLNIRRALRRHDPMIDFESIHLSEVIHSTDVDEDPGVSEDSRLTSVPLKNLKDYFLISSTHTVDSPSSQATSTDGARVGSPERSTAEIVYGN